MESRKKCKNKELKIIVSGSLNMPTFILYISIIGPENQVTAWGVGLLVGKVGSLVREMRSGGRFAGWRGCHGS